MPQPLLPCRGTSCCLSRWDMQHRQCRGDPQPQRWPLQNHMFPFTREDAHGVTAGSAPERGRKGGLLPVLLDHSCFTLCLQHPFPPGWADKAQPLHKGCRPQTVLFHSPEFPVSSDSILLPDLCGHLCASQSGAAHPSSSISTTLPPPKESMRSRCCCHTLIFYL